MSLYYLILWNQVDILKKGSCPICASGRGFTVQAFFIFNRGENKLICNKIIHKLVRNSRLFIKIT